MRVLIVAENASVRFGGEAILPYHYFRLLRVRGLDAHLIVHERTREELQELFPAELERLHFVKDLWMQKLFYKIGRILPRRIDEATFGMANQFLTQLRQRSFVRGLSTSQCVVHQPIPVSPRTPSLLFGLYAPLLVGPLNGGMEYPDAFRENESWVSRMIVALGRSASALLNAVFPGKREAAIVLIANERTRSSLPPGLRGRVLPLPENGVDMKLWEDAVGVPASDPARFVFMGRLVDWKALDIAIEALARTPEIYLDVIGDGPMLAVWRALAVRLGVNERVRFLGWLTQQQCAEQLQSCCALILPSVFECGGAVVLEAMAMRKPVIATAWGGPHDYLDASCGILIEPSSREALIDGFSTSMLRLASSPALARQIGEAGRQRALAEFDWTKKIDTIIDLYKTTLVNSSHESNT